MARHSRGLDFKYYFSKPGMHPFDGVEWVNVDGIDAPKSWSKTSVGIVASKYLRQKGVPRKFSKTGAENSIRLLIERVVDSITTQGWNQGYFKTPKARDVFRSELASLVLTQKAAFNSPVWFNVGLWPKYKLRGQSSLWHWDEKRGTAAQAKSAYEFPQTAACFILSVKDDLESIFELARTEARIFKFGSGAGANFSPLRAKGEPLEHGGSSSGLIAFLEVLDRGAGATKSGGTTRRAAKMVILDADHPEILDFIRWKAREEAKALHLTKAGYSGGMDGEAYRTVSGQNSNNSIRVTDRFMRALSADSDWKLKTRTSNTVAQNLKAKALWREIAEAAWASADPGIQFHDSINRWHTVPNEGEIVASNPCSEFMFVNDSACNLSSINLVNFSRGGLNFDVDGFAAAVRILIVAQEILVSMSGYPTQAVAENSFKLRPLGLGYANLGGLLMGMGLPYDSDEGRGLAGRITQAMTAEAYSVSAELARAKGAFSSYRANKSAMKKIIQSHRKAAKEFKPAGMAALTPLFEHLEISAKRAWSEGQKVAEKYGYRNAQVTVLAPTGTIGLMMDCETTGIEPEYSLVKNKSLAGGGSLSFFNPAVERGLRTLGYSEKEIKTLIEWQRSHSDLSRNPSLKPEHQRVFDCAQPTGPSGICITAKGHLLMMAAVQPFLSGAISKTINLSESATVTDIEEVFRMAWQLGLKSVAIYRDRSKLAQPLQSVAPVCFDCN
jgi:ribonucleoside-diphosphate reductase alpha chain